MKKELFIATLLVIIGMIWSISILANKPSSPKQSLQTTPTPINSTGTTMTLSDVQKHNSSNDCWIIVHDNVYNVSSFLNIHPGGSEKIIPFCGTDATKGFDTKGGEGSHSSKANELLATFALGNVAR